MGFAVATLALTVAAVHLACGSRSSAAPVSATAASSGGEAALTADAIAAAVDPVIRRALAEEGIPGAAFVFVQADRIVYAQGYGVEDRERGVSVDVERTVWPVASVTKLFTGLAALQLVDSGALRLDQDINRYLKQVVVPAQSYPPITLAHLLSHSAALDELPGRQFDPDRVHARRSANFSRRVWCVIARPACTRPIPATALRWSASRSRTPRVSPTTNSFAGASSSRAACARRGSCSATASWKA